MSAAWASPPPARPPLLPGRPWGHPLSPSSVISGGGTVSVIVTQRVVLRRKADESRNGERSSHSQHCRRIMMSIRDELLSGPLGFGAAPLGNMFRNIPEEEAVETVDVAWQQGTRYFDTAPFYGAGLSEIRLGKALAKHRREEYVLSSKVGRLILDEIETKGRDFDE